jgi:hypothetical protein
MASVSLWRELAQFISGMSDIASVHTSMEHSHYLEADNQVHSQSQNSPHSEQPEGCKRRSHLSLFWVRCIFTISHYISCSSVLIFPLRLGFASSLSWFSRRTVCAIFFPLPFRATFSTHLIIRMITSQTYCMSSASFLSFHEVLTVSKNVSKRSGFSVTYKSFVRRLFSTKAAGFCFIWDILVCISDHKSIFIQYPLHTTGVKTVLQARSESWK